MNIVEKEHNMWNNGRGNSIIPRACVRGWVVLVSPCVLGCVL